MTLTAKILNAFELWLWRAIATLLISVWSWSPTQAQQEMIFYAEPPQQPAFLYGNAWRIFADGPIDREAPRRFKALIDKNNVPAHSIIYLNSPGGNLLAGMEIGRLIRKSRYFTQVNQRGSLDPTSDRKSHRAVPSICLSACTLTYLGGVFRWLDPKSVYGVHRIAGNIDFGPDAAQVASSIVVQYIREMGADTDLFDEMTKVGKEEINVLSLRRLAALGVVNNGFERARWTIESGGDFVYLKGERNTLHGMNKFMLMCVGRRLSLYIIFDPLNRGDEVMQMGSQSLLIDDSTIPVSQLKLRPTVLHNGWINAEYQLTPELLQRIRSAKTVGVAFQFYDGAPLFLGFQGLEISPDGRMKLEGLVSTCR